MPKGGSIKLQSKFMEITLWHGCSPINLLHIFIKGFPKNIYGGILLTFPMKNRDVIKILSDGLFHWFLMYVRFMGWEGGGGDRN